MLIINYQEWGPEKKCGVLNPQPNPPPQKPRTPRKTRKSAIKESSAGPTKNGPNFRK